MSGAGTARTRVEHDQGPSTTFGARSRVPSSRAQTRERPLSSVEVIPEDSASNGPHRRVASVPQKANGFPCKSTSERQKGKINLTTRDNIQIRTRSPTKASASDGVDERGSRGSSRQGQGSQASHRAAPPPKKEKEPLRSSYNLGFLGQSADECLYSAMEAICVSHPAYDSTTCLSHFNPTAFYTASRVATARIIEAADTSKTRKCYTGRHTLRLYGLRRPVHSIC